MAFDWRDFFLFAHELRNEKQESKQRSAIGRAYYYIYNAAKIEAKRLGFDETDSIATEHGTAPKALDLVSETSGL